MIKHISNDSSLDNGLYFIGSYKELPKVIKNICEPIYMLDTLVGLRLPVSSFSEFNELLVANQNTRTNRNRLYGFSLRNAAFNFNKKSDFEAFSSSSENSLQLQNNSDDIREKFGEIPCIYLSEAPFSRKLKNMDIVGSKVTIPCPHLGERRIPLQTNYIRISVIDDQSRLKELDVIERFKDDNSGAFYISSAGNKRLTVYATDVTRFTLNLIKLYGFRYRVTRVCNNNSEEFQIPIMIAQLNQIHKLLLP